MNGNSNGENLGREDEEKNEISGDGSPRSVARTQRLAVLQESLPSELKGTEYKNESALWQAQQKIGLSDLQIVLNERRIRCLARDGGH